MFYGAAGVQVQSGTWQEDALRDAKNYRRNHSDSDHLNEMQQAHQHRQMVRLVAAAATVLVAMAVIVLI